MRFTCVKSWKSKHAWKAYYKPKWQKILGELLTPENDASSNPVLLNSAKTDFNKYPSIMDKFLKIYFYKLNYCSTEAELRWVARWDSTHVFSTYEEMALNFINDTPRRHLLHGNYFWRWKHFIQSFLNMRHANQLLRRLWIHSFLFRDFNCTSTNVQTSSRVSR